jgi:5-methyltetrahydrofolate--homocysteine methyltransferase
MRVPFLEPLKERVLIFDGAMGTNIQYLNLTSRDFGGKDGCNEYLVLTKPEAVAGIHESFLKAGCDAIETDTFGANRIVLAEYDLGDRVIDINKRAAEIAREAAKKYSTPNQPRFVAGSIGPGTKLPSLGHIAFDELKAMYKEQISGLVQGGVDILLIETCQDLLQAKAAAIAAIEFFEETGTRLPLMVQVTFERTGTMLLGTEMGAVIAALEMFPVDVIGMNCATGPLEMSDHLRYLTENSMKPVSALPNAGLPENVGGTAHYRLTPGELADFHERFVKEFGIAIVGGCCGTTPEHLKAVVERVRPLKPRVRSPRHESACGSLYSAVTYEQNPPPLLVGERTNANGSRKFKQLLEREDYDGMVGMGREAVKEGSHLIDVCVAYVGRDETRDMIETITRFNQQVPLPIMIDSTEAPVIEEALKRLAGKPIVNSINLEDGEERMRKVCPLAKKYGAALVALTIDERGMAKTAAQKFEVAKRIHDLATQKYGIRAEDLFFDALTFTLGSGDAEFRNAGVETIEAIRRIKKELGGVRTLLGVSNISFGLDPEARQVLNSVFLHEAIQAGLDAAIVNAQKIIPLHKIPEDELALTRDLIFNRHGQKGEDPLHVFLAHFEKKKGTAKKEEKRKPAASVEESLKNKIIDGDRENLEAELERALKKYSALDIINTVLLDGMKVVGDLFGAGKMQLPFVLQSAEVMKKAVAYLEPFMAKVTGREKGMIVLATVKGDVHDIGKNLVDIILTNNGYKVINLGIKQPIDNILKAADEHKADAIGLSGLLVKSTLVMKEDLEEMNQRGITMPVICGGAALTRKYVEDDLAGLYRGEVFYGQDAFAGLRIMEELTRPERVTKAIHTVKVRGAKMEAVITAAQPAKRSDIPYDNPIPEPPFWGYRMVKNIRLDQVYPFVNKLALFKGQWQFKRGHMPAEEYEKVLREKVEPLFEELTARCVREKILEPKAIYGFWPCYAEGNDLVVLDEERKKERVRFTFPRQPGDRFLCLADFFRPKESGAIDVVAFQLVTVGARATEEAQKLFKANRYTDYLYLHGLSVETAEALAEYVHQGIRRDLAIGRQDAERVEELFQQRYQGSRYSFGYPACPNLEDQTKIFQLLPAEKIGVSLTEEFQLVPEQSTSAVVAHHPLAKYFDVR